MDTVDQRIGILVTGLPRLLAELLARAVRAEPDMRLLEWPPEAPLATAINEAGADFVIVGLQDGRLAADCEAFLADRAHVRLLAIEQRDGSAYLYALRPERIEVGDVTPAEAVAFIRRTVAG